MLAAYTCLVLPWLKLKSSREAWQAGLLWLVLNDAFEFTFGHLVAGHTWSRMLQDYDLLEGRLGLVVLLAIVIIPRILFKFRSGSVANKS